MQVIFIFLSLLVFSKISYEEHIFFLDFIYLFLERRKGRREGVKHQCVVASRAPPTGDLGIWPATQACVLTGNQTGNSLVCRPVLTPLSHTSQGNINYFVVKVK